MVDRDIGVGTFHVGRVQGEAVDLLHFRHAGGTPVLGSGHAGSARDFVCRYSSNPATPISLPMPDCL